MYWVNLSGFSEFDCFKNTSVDIYLIVDIFNVINDQL